METDARLKKANQPAPRSEYSKSPETMSNAVKCYAMPIESHCTKLNPDPKPVRVSLRTLCVTQENRLLI